MEYKLIKSLVSKQECNEYSHLLHQLYSEGNFHVDSQCPNSQSFYDLDEFKGVMKRLEQEVKKFASDDIMPVYTYARIYRKGEQLKKHLDRKACEFSITISLDKSGKDNWPFYIQSNKKEEFMLNQGDALIYKGNELYHWRNKLEYEWHSQLFIHYCFKKNFRYAIPDIASNLAKIAKDIKKE